MFDTPYQTTSMSKTGFSGPALERLRSMEINGDLLDVKSRFNIKAIQPNAVAKDVLPFSLPLTKAQIRTMECDVIFDGRAFLRQTGEPLKQDAWDHQVRMCELIAWWMKTPSYERKELLSGGKYLTMAYVRWVTGLLTRSLSLMEDQSYLLSALVAIFFIQLHEPDGAELEAHDQDRILARASRVIPAMDATTLHGRIGDIPKLSNLNDFVEWSTKVINSPRYSKVTVGLILNLSGYAWGPSFTDSSKAALEYPPIFAAMVYTTLLERSFGKTNMGTLLHKIIRSNEDKDFIKSINYILRG